MPSWTASFLILCQLVQKTCNLWIPSGIRRAPKWHPNRRSGAKKLKNLSRAIDFLPGSLSERPWASFWSTLGSFFFVRISHCFRHHVRRLSAAFCFASFSHAISKQTLRTSRNMQKHASKYCICVMYMVCIWSVHGMYYVYGL